MESFCTRNAPPAAEEVPASIEMEVSVREVERIIGYSFKNKKLLEEALTHSSSSSSSATCSPSYERLEFFGDSIIGFTISNYFFFAYPHLAAGDLTWLRSAHVKNDKLARVAVRRGLYDYVRRTNVAVLDNQVKEFAASVLSEEDDGVVYNGSVEALKILADIVESIAAAIYVDLNGDLEKLWPILNGLLEPRDIIKEIRKLHEICQKMQCKQVEIKHTRDTGSIITASVYMDGQFVASDSFDNLETARLKAATLALSKLPQFTPAADDDDDDDDDDVVAGIDGDFEIEEAKSKLNELCQKKKWTEPIYKIDKELGPPHQRIFMSSVVVVTPDRMIFMRGDGKTRRIYSENSAASLMIHYLQEPSYV